MYVRISRIIRIISYTGGAHAVDSSDIAFRMAAIGAMRQGKFEASMQDYPVWNLKMTTPDNTPYQGVRCYTFLDLHVDHFACEAQRNILSILLYARANVGQQHCLVCSEKLVASGNRQSMNLLECTHETTAWNRAVIWMGHFPCPETKFECIQTNFVDILN